MSSRSQLKQWFQRGKKPTQAQFADAFDSFFHKTEDQIQISDINQLTQALAGKAAIAHTHDTDDIQGLRDTVAEIMEDFLPETEEQPRAIVYVADIAALSDVQDPSTDALYITEDQGQLYKYRDGEFTLVEEEETVESGTFVVHGTFTQMDNRLKGVLTTCTKDCVLIQTGNAIATYRFVSVAQTKDGITKMQQTLVKEARNGVDGNTRTRTGTIRTVNDEPVITWSAWTLRTPIYKESTLSDLATTAKTLVAAINELKAAQQQATPTITYQQLTQGNALDQYTAPGFYPLVITGIPVSLDYTADWCATLFVSRTNFMGNAVPTQYLIAWNDYASARTMMAAGSYYGRFYDWQAQRWGTWQKTYLDQYEGLDPDTDSVELQEQTSAQIYVNGLRQWEVAGSDDEGVATAQRSGENLNITAVAAGTCVVTLVANDLFCPATATVTVTVTSAGDNGNNDSGGEEPDLQSIEQEGCAAAQEDAEYGDTPNPWDETTEPEQYDAWQHGYDDQWNNDHQSEPEEPENN